jgi:hypothetical protein
MVESNSQPTVLSANSALRRGSDWLLGFTKKNFGKVATISQKLEMIKPAIKPVT